MSVAFHLDADQVAKRDAWLDEHQKKTGHVTAYAGAIGGTFTYSFTPTSIGVVAKIQCGFCKEACDLSDYENW